MRKSENIDSFQRWLSGLRLSVKPTLKINNGFNGAIVVVDFGTPKEPVHLSSEISGELNHRMKDLASAITGKRNFRVSYDSANGVYWASAQ